MTGEDGQENIPHREWFIVFDRVISEVKGELSRQGRGDEFIGARVRIVENGPVSVSFPKPCRGPT